MEISRVEDEFSDKTSSENENERQRTVRDDDNDHGASSSDSLMERQRPNRRKFRWREKNVSNGAEGPVRSCPYCGKKFSPGQALGGHIRMHEKPKAYKSVPKVLSTVTDKKEKGDNTCFICKERFPSIMSLCGHMRNHPERDWKGIRPPNSDETTPEPDTRLLQQEPAKNLPNCISNWSVTGKRGRKASIKDKLAINRVPEKKRKLRNSEDGNQSKFPRQELKTEKAASILEEEDILEKDLPEEGEIIEEELNIRKVDDGSSISEDVLTNSFSTFQALGIQRVSHGKINDFDHLGELAFSDATIVDKKHREASSSGSNVGKSKKIARHGKTYQARSNHKICLQMETADNPLSRITSQEEAKEVGFRGEPAGESGFDHKASLSPEAIQAGTAKMLDFDLNLPHEE
ncbi:hypothetical protein POUND7_013278 [Theobroma cacao]